MNGLINELISKIRYHIVLEQEQRKASWAVVVDMVVVVVGVFVVVASWVQAAEAASWVAQVEAASWEAMAASLAGARAGVASSAVRYTSGQSSAVRA